MPGSASASNQSKELESREHFTKGAHHHLSYHLMVCKGFLCKQIGMQIAFVCFFPPFYLKAFQADLKHCVHPAITHTYTWLCTHTHTHIEDNVFWHDRAGQTSDEWSPSPPGLIFSRLSRCLCAQINQAPCSNQSHLYLPANKWHCWEGEINRG